MIFFERLFAAYYFLMIRFRRISKSRIEDTQAMFFVLTAIFLLMIIITGVIKQFIAIDTSLIPNYVFFIFLAGMMIGGYVYFLSNRSRRNRIIESFRDAAPGKKRAWTFIAVALIVLPLPIFAILF